MGLEQNKSHTVPPPERSNEAEGNGTAVAPPPVVKRRTFRDWIRDGVGVDRPIFFAVSARVWSSAAGLATVVLIARYLSAAEQGYYYTYASLVGLQIVFELGFSFVILQVATHERAHLTISSDYEISGDRVAKARLASVLQKTVRWYATASALMLVTIIPVGIWFFQSHDQGASNISWRLPWYCAVGAAAVNFLLDPFLSFFEGCGFVADVAKLRLIQSVVANALSWLALAAHAGLFAPALDLAGIAVASIFWLSKRRHLLFQLLKLKPGTNRIHWKSEVWPFQWRIAISWLCGFFVLQIFNPLLFAFRGAVAAGQMGMSLSIVAALQGVSWSWMNTKVAPFGALVARKERAQLDKIFFRTLKQALGVHLLGAIAILTGAVYLEYAGISFSRRMLPPSLLAVLLAATTVNLIVLAESTYLRVHKVERFLLNSVLTFLFTTVLAYVCGRHYGASGMAIVYLAVLFGISLTLGTATFFTFWKSCHPQ